MNNGLLFANYECTGKTAVLKDTFSNPFLDFPIEQLKGNPKTDISASKSVFG